MSNFGVGYLARKSQQVLEIYWQVSGIFNSYVHITNLAAAHFSQIKVELDKMKLYSKH